MVGRDPASARLDETVAARAPWSIILRAGKTLRIIDLEGQPAVDTLIYNAHDTTERYSAQDTIASQQTAYVTTGTRLLSNEGRCLATVVADSCGLTRRDLVGNINFFMNVPILPNGDLAIDDGVSVPGSHVELRADMDVIVLISNCPQVNNPCNGFDPTPIRVLVWPPETAA